MQYVVVIADKKLNGKYGIQTTEQGLLPVTVDHKAPELDGPNIEEMYDWTALTMGRSYNIFFCKDEKAAKQVANELSAAYSNKQIYWAKLCGAYESIPSKPIEKTISDKGVFTV